MEKYPTKTFDFQGRKGETSFSGKWRPLQNMETSLQTGISRTYYQYGLNLMCYLRYKPELSPAKTIENLFHLMEPGEISNEKLKLRISRLDERFRAYLSLCPFGIWAPGLAVGGEMRSFTEIYLPIDEIRDAFDLLLSLSLNFPPGSGATPIHTSVSWLDALVDLQPHVGTSNPAALLKRLAADENYRIRFLFALFLPGKHGGSFDRYPGQREFLKNWVADRLRHGVDRLRCLDSACATGESTYELAMTLRQNGIKPGTYLIHGSTLETLELFSAAHIFFPHDTKRQVSYRQTAEPLFESGGADGIEFFRDDITLPSEADNEGYDIILCNGLVGGPMFHSGDKIAKAATGLGKRLRDGGIILAADRFHGGWKKLAPDSLIREIFRNHGFRVQDISDGFAALKEMK